LKFEVLNTWAPQAPETSSIQIVCVNLGVQHDDISNELVLGELQAVNFCGSWFAEECITVIKHGVDNWGS